MKRFKDWQLPWIDGEGFAFDSYITQRPYGWRCFHNKNLKLGKECDIGHGTLIQAKYGVEIGKEVEIGPFCYLCSWSTIDNKKGKIIVKEKAKIGVHSTIMPGITIGKNSTIGAYSFVNKNIPDDVIAYGIPCEVQKEKKFKKPAPRWE